MSNNIDYDALKITKTLVVSENVYEQSFEKKCTYVRILNDIYNNKYLYIFEYVCTSEGNGRPSTIFKEQLIPIDNKDIDDDEFNWKHFCICNNENAIILQEDSSYSVHSIKEIRLIPIIKNSYRYLYNDQDEICYWIDCFDYQSMDNGVWVPHYKPQPEEIISYHGFNPSSDDKIEMFKDSLKAKKIMWRADEKKQRPSNNDICPICSKKIKLVSKE